MASESSGGNEYLSTLPSNIFYNNIKKNHSDLSGYSEQCDTNSVNNYKEEAKQICKNILRYLDKYAASIDNKTEYDVCILLNYWIYDTLTEILGSENTSKKINLAFGSLQWMWNYPVDALKRTAYYNKCQPNFDIVKHEDWKKRKELYEYYVDYKTILYTANNFDKTCNEFYKRIEEKKKLYEYFEEICDSKPAECPNFYEQCKEYKPELVLHNFSCHENIVAAKNALATQHTLIQGLSDGDRARDPNSSEHGADSSEMGITQDNFDVGTKVGKSILGLAPIAITASALYKFTPMGLWIRKLTGSNQNITGNMDGEDGFLDHTQDSSNILFNGAENYISYQPI
ncbi:PIR Superfamily Protein [Plasmodium ovale curtisi]|uniref:PIR Superfamily Protein n=1 Tax=Plasmodium ovale curtisi TaxID=864141 RepID=A0A1A8XCN6_PLAOA|nr:PIR Superfamily Protein [Plasmodium ovale curtisi]